MNVSAKEAKEMLHVRDPIEPVAWVNGHPIDEDGDRYDPRLTKPHVWCLGPFGSWPDEGLEAVYQKFDEHDVWTVGKSFRLGPVVVWERGWGFAISEASYERKLKECFAEATSGVRTAEDLLRYLLVQGHWHDSSITLSPVPGGAKNLHDLAVRILDSDEEGR